jgi:hypothetical protein
MGKTPLIKEIQLESIDEDLRNGLWNVYSLHILKSIEEASSYRHSNPRTYFSNILWHDYFKQPIDKIPSFFPNVIQRIREYFFKCQWYEIYDLIEGSIHIIDDDNFDIDLKILFDDFNYVLEREFAGYRFIDQTLSPITNQTEIEEIKEAISLTDNFTSLKGCNFHLKDALSKLSNRQNPDYRNSIKESVSAIESLAKIISNSSKDSLGASLDKIKGKIKIHSALEKGFKQIYGYTSDSDGIRHGLMEEPTCDFEDAKFMLVSCSAFINYLVAKSLKADIKFS